MIGIITVFKEIYIRFIVWLGAEPPSGYENLLPASERVKPVVVPTPIKEPEPPKPVVIPTPVKKPETPKPVVIPTPVKKPEPPKPAVVISPPVEKPETPKPAVVTSPPVELEDSSLPDLPDWLQDFEPDEPDIIEEVTTSPPPFETAVALPPLPPEIDTAFRYEVQRGDTLNSIAKRYDLTVEELVEANNITSSSRIFPSQKMIIPGYMSGTKIETKPVPMPPSRPMPAPPPKPKPTPSPKPTPPPKPKPTPSPKPTPPPQKPKPTPSLKIDASFPPVGSIEAVRALYVSYFALGHNKTLSHIFNLLNTTELNAVVIDVKSDHGWISYPTQVSLAREIGAARPSVKNFTEVMAQLKARNIYTIARMVTFKDNPLANNYPDLAVKIQGSGAVWQDHEKSGWTDPFQEAVWDYNIRLAIEAAQLGFDEIQFDYLRFPTASQAGTPQFSQEATRESRVAAITGFLSTVRGQLEPFNIKLAADTFGYTCWRKDDTLIGQDIDRLGQYLDVLSPKLHPSTFGNGIPGYQNAAAHPYEVVYESARRAVERVSSYGCVVRPWIQDFPDYRFDKQVYGKEELQAQIKGCFDADSVGFMVWDPRVQYTANAYAPLTK